MREAALADCKTTGFQRMPKIPDSTADRARKVDDVGRVTNLEPGDESQLGQRSAR